MARSHLAETRWSLELDRLLVDPVFVPLGVPRGDGRPVVLMPGFLAGDQTLSVMAAWLWRLGYQPRTCGFVANADCTERTSVRIEKLVRSLHRRAGRRVALIGHSRGGHFARALATRRPACVSPAISLGGGPQQKFEVSARTQAAVGVVRRGLHLSAWARGEHCFTNECDCEFSRNSAGEFPADSVRLTSIYSKREGVVRWPACLVPYADCVEVTGSYVGLICNRKSYRAVATALGAPELPLEPGALTARHRYRIPRRRETHADVRYALHPPRRGARHGLLLRPRTVRRRGVGSVHGHAQVRGSGGATGDQRLLGAG